MLPFVMAFEFRLQGINFNTGDHLEVPPRGVVVLVGPNNAGKSLALRNIAHYVASPHPPTTRVVQSLDFHREGTEADLEAWLTEHSFRRVDGQGTVYFKRPNVDAAWNALRGEWGGGGPPFPTLASFLVFPGWADNRLGLVSPSSPYDPMNDSPGQPMQVLYARRDLEEQISATSTAAFGTPLTLARAGGSSQLSLHVGALEPPAEPTPSQEYIDAIRGMPPLHEQGDGVRSFMGIMLSLLTAQYPLILIDEPEAFLHPPQARLLGQTLARDVPEHTQVIVATHSLDVLQGMLDVQDAQVTVVRIKREDDRNPVAVLGHDEIREVWRDPLLRASQTLSGLFHPGVVACEADGDALFYSAALDAEREHQGRGAHDYLFAYASTKARLAVIACSMRALGVPCAVIADLDVLRDAALLQSIVEALGGVWDDGLRTPWNTVRGAVTALEHNPTKVFVEERVQAVLRIAPGPSITRQEAERIRDAVKIEDGWAQLKRSGIGGIPQGNPSAAAQDLIDRLGAIGLFVVPVGELERWVPDVGGHGPSWVSNVLANARQNDASPREFVRQLDDVLG
jgi:hypothetical protein